MDKINKEELFLKILAFMYVMDGQFENKNQWRSSFVEFLATELNIEMPLSDSLTELLW